jgi:glycerol-3-phosphate dehydrogenase
MDQADLSLARREENLESMSRQEWDVLIIGGGINGAGLARDLSLRSAIEKLGLKIALIEKAHFGSGASSRNSQLVHGGLRYLKYLNFSLVREALRERRTLLRIAPHLVRPQAFLLPFRNRAAALYFSAGLLLYDALAGRNAIQPFRLVERNELIRTAPRLNHHGAGSAAIFYDGVMEAARLVLENVRDAHRLGATVANYTAADQFLMDQRGRIIGVGARDALSNRSLNIKARLVVNAAGPWGDALRVKSSSSPRSLRLVRGSHLIFPQLFDDKLALSFFDRQGRIVFAIPWGTAGELTLVGTTEVLHDADPDRVQISASEREYLMDAVAEWLPHIRNQAPVGSYSSLRPLIAGNSTSLTSASRAARIWIGKEGMLHITGGKYTTYRAMAAAAAELVCRELKIKCRRKDLTAQYPLGARAPVVENEEEQARIAARYDLDQAQIDYLARLYGSRLEELLSMAEAANALHRIHPELPAVYGQLLFAIRREMAARLSDFTSISTYLRYYRRWTREELQRLTQFMGDQLGWDKSKIEQEVEDEYAQNFTNGEMNTNR